MPAAPSRRWRSAADRSSRWSVELTDHSLSTRCRTAGTVRDADGNEQRLRSRREPARVHDVVCTPFAYAMCRRTVLHIGAAALRLCPIQSTGECACLALPAGQPGWLGLQPPVSATSRCEVFLCTGSSPPLSLHSTGAHVFMCHGVWLTINADTNQ